MEIRHLLPIMVQAVRELDRDGISEAVLIEAPGMKGVVDEVFASLGGEGVIRRICGSDRRIELASSSLAWTASGTATLECALLDVPMVVGYRLQPASFAIARLLVRVPHVALVNLIAGDRVAPELIQKEWSSDRLVEISRQLLGGGADEQRPALARVRRRLGSPGASRRAAEAVLEHS